MGLSCKEAPSQGVSLLGCHMVNWEGNFEGRTADLQPGGESHPKNQGENFSREDWRVPELGTKKVWCVQEKRGGQCTCVTRVRGERNARQKEGALGFCSALQSDFPLLQGFYLKSICMKFLVTPFIPGKIPV